MKKIFVVFACTIVLFSCKKDEDKTSQVVTVSFPTITLTGEKFYSINTGGTVPVLTATAYDSILQESYTPKYDVSGIDNNKPGLYVVDFTATNKYGYIGHNTVFIAVTNVPATSNLSGIYVRAGSTAHVTKIKNGLYETDNVGGAAAPANTVAYFAHLNDTTIDLPVQPTPDGNIGVRDAAHPDDYGVLHMAPGDTSYTYTLNAGGSLYGITAVRVFQKQ